MRIEAFHDDIAFHGGNIYSEVIFDGVRVEFKGGQT